MVWSSTLPAVMQQEGLVGRKDHTSTLGGALHLNSILHQNYNVSAGPGVSDALAAGDMMPAGVWL